MPLVVQKNISGIEMFLWRVTETEEQLRAVVSMNDAASVSGFTSDIRRRERLAWRAALRASGVKQEVMYDDNGAPYLKDSQQHVSVAHCKGMVCLVLSYGRCGVDIESAERDCSRAKHRFLTDRERKLLDDQANIEGAAWCAKEALYKYSSSPGLDFLKDIRLTGKSEAGFCAVVNEELAEVIILHEENCIIALALGKGMK